MLCQKRGENYDDEGVTIFKRDYGREKVYEGETDEKNASMGVANSSESGITGDEGREMGRPRQEKRILSVSLFCMSLTVYLPILAGNSRYLLLSSENR